MYKGEMRAAMRRARGKILDRQEKSARICRHILEMPEYLESKCVLFYMAIGSEADLSLAMEAAVRQGKRVLAPVCADNGDMIAVEARPAGNFRKGAFGILEPVGKAADPEEIDLVLCPGLAFDARGRRLGYGRGYYDRFLPKTRAFFAGICFSACMVENVPASAHDVPMRALVSEQGILRIGGRA